MNATRRTTTTLLLSILLAACGGELDLETTPSAVTGACSLVTTASNPGVNGSTPGRAFDRDLATGFATNFNSWQYLQLDFGCPVRVTGIRRHLSSSTSPNRVQQGEQVLVSSDGVNWTHLTPQTTFGWSGYVAYSPNAWHSVPYGWSAWLRPTTALTVRFLRYRWDGNNDVLNELEVDSRVVTTDQPPTTGRGYDAFDGNTATGFRTAYPDWQYVQVDLGEQRLINRVRRHMSGVGSTRGAVGEQFLYSADGLSWTYFSASNSSGWPYTNYTPTAWSNVPYGWSAWLKLNAAVVARYVRFRFDANNDSVNEVEIGEFTDGGDVSYDFSPRDATYAGSVGAYLASFHFNPNFQTFNSSRAKHLVGFTGTYQGRIFGNGSTLAYLTLTDDGVDVRGELLIGDDGRLIYDGGLFCGTTPFARGTRIAVRMHHWVGYDGRYSAYDASYHPSFGDARHFGEGFTHRRADGSGVSDYVDSTFHAMLQTSDVYGSRLVGDLQIDAPSVCADDNFTFYFVRDDVALAPALGF